MAYKLLDMARVRCLPIYLSASTRTFRGLSALIVDRAKLARSILGAQQFMHLHADAIGRKSTVWPKVGCIWTQAAEERKPLVGVTPSG